MEQSIPDQQDYERCILQWERMLEHFKAGRPILQDEKENLWKLLASGVSLWELCHAISGMRFEPPTQTYVPSKHISVYKLWDIERRTKFITLSTAEQKRRQDKAMGIK